MTGSGHHAARTILFVPAHAGALGQVIRLFRTPLGAPTAVGFTSAEKLTAVLGDTQQWIRLAEPAVRATVGPLGVAQLVIDPTLAARAAAPISSATPALVAGSAATQGQPA